MTLNFYQYGTDKLTATLELDESKSSIIDKLNEPTRLSATLTSTTAPTLQLGARTTYHGVTYYVTKEPTIRKEHSQLYTIEADLETVIGLTRLVVLDNPVDKRSSFDYTATATEHIQLVVDSLNGKKLRKIPAWTRGKIRVPDKVKHIKYDGISAWDALQLIRQTYETDLHIDGTAIDLGIWSDKNNAIELAYGKDNGILSGLERIKHDDTPTPMCLYVTGTKRNMVKGRLTMQPLETLKVDSDGNILHGDNASGRIFTTDKTGQYISEFTHDNGTQPLYTEATYTNEEIYPSHVSTVRSVTKVKDHFEVNSDFDYRPLIIEGEQMQVVFQTGNLAGRDFDAKYFASSNRLAIVPKEEDDTTLPNDTLCPKVGDQYIVTGIKLPDKYITEAQRKLTDDALSHLLKLQQQRYSYKAEIDPVYLHNNRNTIGTKLDVGQYVHLTDQQIAVGDPYIRIIAKRTYLDRPYTPEIELSNEVERLSLLDRLIRNTDGMLLDSKLILGRVNSQGLSLSDYSQRLKIAEEGLRGKLSSEDFGKWQAGDYSQRQSALDKALASKQPAGSYALTSQLVTTQQQAIAEALKRAEEMDKQIKVGGRNLFRKEYFIGEVASRYNIPFDALQPRDGDNTYTLSLDYKISSEDKASSPRISCLYSNNGGWLVDDSDIKRDGEWHHKEYTIQIKQTDPSKYPIYGWFTDYSSRNGRTIDMVAVRNIKLERGTVATDWTPAPEDVAESVSKVSTSLSSLERALLDPQQGRIQKLEELLGEHSESFDALDSHPLTVDEAGYWKIWSVKDSQYVTTQYPSRGRDGQDGAKGDKGEKGDTPLISLDSQFRLVSDGKLMSPVSLKGQDAGCYLGRAKRIHPDFNGNYLLETDTEFKWLTAKEGDYVYLVGDAPNRGGDKDTYYIVREHKGNTVWEVYDIKGHTPILSLDSQFRLLADNKPVSNLSLKGDKGDQGDKGEQGAKGDQGDKGEAGHTPELHIGEDDYLYIDGAKQRYLRGPQGEAGHSPSPTEVLSNPTFSQQLTSKVTSEVTSQVKPITTDITNLQKVALTKQQQLDVASLTQSLQVLRSGNNNTLEGLALQRLIALSGNGKDISAYLASDTLGAVLKAGITGFGTPNEREQVEITHQGTGHLGNLYFTGSQIDFKTGRYDAPYLSIGAEEATFIDSFVNNARVIDTPVSVSSVTLTTSFERSVSVANDGTRLTVTLEKINVAVYGSSKLRLTLDGETLAEWRGSAKYTDTSGRDEAGGSYKIDYTPYEASNLSYERVVKAGNHTVRLEIVAPRNGNATVNGLRVRRRYDTGAQQSVLTKSGLRLFASPDRYFDIDYRKSVWDSAPNRLGQWIANPYLVRIKGGAKVDKLTADELDAPGVPLCGASFNERGGQIKAFGKYVNQRGYSRAQAEYDNGMAAFKVYHSIGHTNYIPIVQVSGFASNDINWSLTPRVYNITSEYFVVRILTNNDNPTARGISYVAYKTM